MSDTVSWPPVVAILLSAATLCWVYYGGLSQPVGNRRAVRSKATRALQAGNPESSSEEEADEDQDEKHNTKPCQDATPTDHLDSDPGLLRKHSLFKAYTTPVASYPSVRTFFCPHPHIEKLPTNPKPLPLLVFVHGLGGSLAQFHPLLTTLTNVAPCFGIDFPGCGLSTFAPKAWAAYTAEALAALLATAIERHRDVARGQEVILIGHSLGCSIAALVASPKCPVGSELKELIAGLVCICPQASPPSASTASRYRQLLHIPEPIFNAWRRWDRRGGTNSPSVVRFLGPDADLETRKLQIRFNEQSRTPVWRRMAWGTLQTYDATGKATGGIPGESIWSSMTMPLLLTAGDSDCVTKPIEVSKIISYLRKGASDDAGHDNPSETSVSPNLKGSSGRKSIVKTFIFPAPASHALPYDRTTCRALSGLIQEFLSSHVDERLDLGWQLQHLTTSGKWDVKNLAKWEAVAPVSEPIGNTFFALKTLRDVDKVHSPIPFAERWKGRIYAIIDISHESPVYNPEQLNRGGIHYHKLPTVSKIPPTQSEVREFVSLVDRLEEEISTQPIKENLSDNAWPLIGVHCHYGFNRTGFFLTSYLIERKGFTVEEALEEFKLRRPPGIRHSHFIDTLFVRYCTGNRNQA